MLIVAEVHLPTLPLLIAGSICLVAIAWYWSKLGEGGVPPVRRAVRRASLACGLVVVVAATYGFGIVDPDVRPRPYVAAWLIGGVALLATILLAVVDAVVSVVLHRRELAEWRAERAGRLADPLGRGQLGQPGHVGGEERPK